MSLPRPQFFWARNWGKQTCLKKERNMLNETKDVEVKRWSSGRKKQVVLRLLRGESVDAPVA
jgi:hypothetical protein